MKKVKRQTSKKVTEKQRFLKKRKPKEGKWEWLIIGCITFFGMSYFIYKHITSTGNQHDDEHTQRGMLQVSVVMILFAIVAFSMLKNSVVNIIYKLRASEKLTIDDIGHLFLVISTTLSLICLIFFIDWSNWHYYISHISAVASVTIVRIIWGFFQLRKLKKEN